MGGAQLISNCESSESIINLENELKKHEQVELTTEHHFCGGIYARELFIPKGTILTGKMHRHDHLNVMLYGDIEVATAQGNRRITSPCVILSEAGTKRAGYAHEDTVWITLHATKETKLEKLERIFIIDDAPEIESAKKLEG